MTPTPTPDATTPTRTGWPIRRERKPRPRMSDDLLAALANRLTPRDVWLLHMLLEHRVFTTTQIAQLAYGTTTTAAHRLHQLWQYRAVDRQQPLVERGSAPMHYVLGDAGAAVLAARHDTTVRELGYRRATALGILHSAKLAHTVGVNGLLAALVAHARTSNSAHLHTWWPERRCLHHWGDLARPDAYARWQDGARTLEFFLEYDTGTEPLNRLANKLADYADLAHATGITSPVLFWFTSPTRETHARAALRNAPVAVATAAPQPGNANPAIALWRPLDGEGEPRLSLAALADADHSPLPPASALGSPTAMGVPDAFSIGPMPPDPPTAGISPRTRPPRTL